MEKNLYIDASHPNETRVDSFNILSVIKFCLIVVPYL